MGEGLNRRLPDHCFKGLIMIGAGVCSDPYWPLWAQNACKITKYMGNGRLGVEIKAQNYDYLTFLFFFIFFSIGVDPFPVLVRACG